MDLGLAGRVYVVSGGSRGLGRAAADALVAEGARVVLSGRTRETVDAACADLGAERAAGVVADNADPETAPSLVRTAVEVFGRLDGALVSVGGPPTGSVMETRDEDWESSFASVFLGAVRLARATAAGVSEGGSIALVLSTSVKAPLSGLTISNGLRPGLAMVAKSLADELGPRGVRVNGLMPGRFATERVEQLDAQTGDPASARARHEQAIPLRRYGRPSEFGAVAAFVLSPVASYLTGSMVAVDGGSLRAL